MSATTRFTTPIGSHTRKAELEDIAMALELDTSGNKKLLTGRITKHLQANPDLAQTPRFQGLYSGRANNPTKAAGKNSGDKAGEDAAAAKDAPGSPTSAHKKLLDGGYTVDAGARFTLLQQGLDEKDRGSKLEGHSSDDDDHSSSVDKDPSTLSSPLSEQEEGDDATLRPAVIKGSTIMVVFEHESNRQEPAREAHVTGIPVYVGQGSIDGRPQFTARLTDLLPGAFAQDIGALSPIKNSNARLYRRGVADPDSHSGLGYVQDVLDPSRQPKSLGVERLNQYPLESFGADLFSCRLFYKGTDESAPAPPAPAVKTEVQSEYPLLQAREMVAAQREADVAATDQGKEPAVGFFKFLRGELKVSLEDLPARRATAMPIVLARYNLLNRALGHVHSWVRPNSKAGYQVPPYNQYGQFARVEFTKLDLLAALRMKPTQTRDDTSLLSDSALRPVEKAYDWAHNPETSKYRERFEKMTVADFKAYVKKRGGNVTTSASKPKPIYVGSSDEDGNRHAERKRLDKKRCRRDEDDSEGESKVKASKKGKKKAASSDNLDNSESSESD